MPKRTKVAKTNVTSKKNRGILLTAWLYLTMALFAIASLGSVGLIVAGGLGFPLVLFYVLLLIDILGIIFTYFLFKWKKWALYGIFCIAVLSFIINSVYQERLTFPILIIWFLILILLFRGKINFLE